MKKVLPLKKNQVPIIEMFENELRKYLPFNSYNKTVPAQMQNEVLTRLKNNSEKNKFSFVLDGITSQIIYCYGTNKWLGFDEKKFTLLNFLEATHPQHALAHWLNGSSVWDLLEEQKANIRFNDISFVHNLAIKKSDNKYLYCSCEAFLFQVSDNKKGLEFAYEFTIIKEFKDELFTAYYFDRTGIRQDLLSKHNYFKKNRFLNAKLFTKQELKIITLYAYNEISAEQIGKLLSLSKTTILKHNTNILNKAQIFFFKKFETTKAFALHLIKLELL